MSPKAELASVAPTELVFVWAFHNLPGISEAEWVDYYAPHETRRLGGDLKSYIEHQLNLFSENSNYAEYFSLADYDDPADSLGDVEEVTFRSALSPSEQNTPLGELDATAVLQDSARSSSSASPPAIWPKSVVDSNSSTVS
jgi:hypothetical protein